MDLDLVKYDPASGQFLTRDPLESVTRSAYGYVGNNPINYVDPTGEFGILAAIAVFEIGSTLWDAYDAYGTFSNDCSGSGAKWFSSGALLAGSTHLQVPLLREPAGTVPPLIPHDAST